MGNFFGNYSKTKLFNSDPYYTAVYEHFNTNNAPPITDTSLSTLNNIKNSIDSRVSKIENSFTRGYDTSPFSIFWSDVNLLNNTDIKTNLLGSINFSNISDFTQSHSGSIGINQLVNNSYIIHKMVGYQYGLQIGIVIAIADYSVISKSAISIAYYTWSGGYQYGMPDNSYSVQLYPILYKVNSSVSPTSTNITYSQNIPYARLSENIYFTANYDQAFAANYVNSNISVNVKDPTGLSTIKYAVIVLSGAP